MDTSTPENVLQTQNDMQGLVGNCHRSLLIIGHLSGILLVNRHGMCKEEKYTRIYGGLKDLDICACAKQMQCYERPTLTIIQIQFVPIDTSVSYGDF